MLLLSNNNCRKMTMVLLLATANLQPVSGCCFNDRRHRLAASSQPTGLGDQEMARCGTVPYNLAVRLYNQHFGLTALPLSTPLAITAGGVELLDDPAEEGSTVMECPALYIHNDHFGKVIWRLQDLQNDMKVFTDEDTYELGSYTLSAIMEAYEAVADTTESASVISGQGQYDVIDNNCATFVMSLMEYLNIPITSDHVAFVVNSFDRQGHMFGAEAFIRGLRSHPLFASYFHGGEGVDDKLLMMEYAIFYVESHMSGGNNDADHNSLVGCAANQDSPSTANVITRRMGLLLVGSVAAVITMWL